MKGRPNSLVVAVVAALVCVTAAHGAGSSADPEGDSREALLAAVGTLSGANAYVTFMALGAVADGWANEVYTAEKAAGIAVALRRLAQAAASGLGALLGRGSVGEEDRQYVNGMVEAYGHLAAEADGLSAWIETGERRAFDEARQAAWKAILTTLGPPEEEALE